MFGVGAAASGAAASVGAASGAVAAAAVVAAVVASAVSVTCGKARLQRRPIMRSSALLLPAVLSVSGHACMPACVFVLGLCRWDQVALVRQYRDGFGAEDGSSKGRGAGVRLPTEEYEAKLCSILKRQQAALRADEPVVTDTDDDLPPSTPQQQQQLGADAAAAAGVAAAATTAGQQQQSGAGEDVADALFAGCEDSDHEVYFSTVY